MLFTDFRQYGEHGDWSKIVLTVLFAIFKERCDVRHFPFSWKTATLYRQIDQPRQSTMAVQKRVRPALELAHYILWDTFFTNIIIICRKLSLP